MAKHSQINAGLKSKLSRISQRKIQCEYWNEQLCWEYSTK